MNRRLVTLTERRTRPVRLRRAEANFLLAHARHLIEVVPTFERGMYHLTARGFVGFLDGPTTRYLIRPKIPWPSLRLLLGLSSAPGSESTEPEDDLLAVLADEFASRLEMVTQAGLVPGYGEQASISPFLRGKLRTADQLRNTAAGAFPDRFHIDEPVFDLHTSWNRIPKATGCALLCNPNLPTSVRQRVEASLQPLAGIPDGPVAESDFTASSTEPRAAGYLPLLKICRLILNGLICVNPKSTESSAFLVDLSREFERYLLSALKQCLVARPRWHVEGHPPLAIGPTELQPDILIRHNGEPWAVLDAKWKTRQHEASDLHQVLAYASMTGVGRVGLVYPGQTNKRIHFTTPGGSVRVSLYQLRVVGTAAKLTDSVAMLARAVRKE